MDRDTYIMKKRLQEFKEDLKSLLTEDFKEKDPDTYYQLTSIINKYYGRNPYEDDGD